MRSRIDAAIHRLPPPLREVVVLREFEDLSCAAISQIVAAPIDTVMSRLARARAKMRAGLGADVGQA